jgi:hypothetical protein
MPRLRVPPPGRLFLVLLTALIAAAGVASAGAETASAAKPCWERVFDDWIDGRIDGVYSASCLQAALRNAPEDVRAYSDFEELVKQARQDALRSRFLQGSGSGGGTSPGTTPGASEPDRMQEEQVEEVEPNVRKDDRKGPIGEALGYGTTDASSIPLPLIVLAALALLLLAAGGAGLVHRKLQARKTRSS